MTDVVLDASALLALLRSEPGAARVNAALPQAAISAVNLAEVVAKLAEHGVPVDAVSQALRSFELPVVPFDEPLAYLAGELRAATRDAGISFGDRVCLALARHRAAIALTADRSWVELDVGVEIELIR
jgi:PIN domain nuclease of toxin-antitoxin system